LFGLVTLAVVALDQLAKELATSAVGRGETGEIIFGVKVVNVRNDGVAFGMFSGSDFLVVAFAVVAMTALCAYFAFNATRRGLWLAAGLLAGGALSNLIDRLRIGSVVDFIDLPAWPPFNLADVAIVLGAIGLGLTILKAPQPNG